MADANSSSPAANRKAARIARQAAKASAALTYIGTTCPRGHSGLRYTGHGVCVECASEKAKSAAKKAYDKARYQSEAVRAHVVARSASYYALNAERAKATTRAWVLRNPDRRRDISQSYKHRRRTVESTGITGAELGAWKKAQKKVCYWCGQKCEKSHVVDHYVPLAKGGKHEIGNLVIACRPCNAQKSAKDPIEFAKSRGRLF